MEKGIVSASLREEERQFETALRIKASKDTSKPKQGIHLFLIVRLTGCSYHPARLL